jgi:hypothetical protein
MKKNSLYYISLIAHIAFIIFIIISPFVFDWKVILIGAVIFYCYRILFVILNNKYGCFLSKIQFGDDTGFLEYYAKKLGVKSPARIISILTLIAPIILLIITVAREF